LTVVARPVVRCDRDELASALSISPRRVNQLADTSVVKRLDRGEYDLFASMTGYIVFLHGAMGKKSTMDERGNVTSSHHQRSRLLDVELAKAELELAKLREQVMAVDDHKSVVGNLILETKARVMAIGARTAPKVMNLKTRSAVKQMIDGECLNALVDMSRAAMPVPQPPVVGDPRPVDDETATGAASATSKERRLRKTKAKTKRARKTVMR
jgi:hypothetical protein